MITRDGSGILSEAVSLLVQGLFHRQHVAHSLCSFLLCAGGDVGAGVQNEAGTGCIPADAEKKQRGSVRLNVPHAFFFVFSSAKVKSFAALVCGFVVKLAIARPMVCGSWYMVMIRPKPPATPLMTSIVAAVIAPLRKARIKVLKLRLRLMTKP